MVVSQGPHILHRTGTQLSLLLVPTVPPTGLGAGNGLRVYNFYLQGLGIVGLPHFTGLLPYFPWCRGLALAGNRQGPCRTP